MSLPAASELDPDYLQALEACHRRNSLLFYADGFLFLFGLSMFFPSTILAGYVDRFSTTATAAATLTMLFLVGIALPQPFAAFVSHRRERRKGLVFAGALLQKLPVLLMAIFSFFDVEHPHLVLPVVYVLVGIFCFASGFVSPIWVDWIGRVLDPRRRGRTLGLRSFWSALGGLLGSLLAGWVLETEATGRPYSLLFCLATLFMGLSLPCLLYMVEPSYPVRTRVDPFRIFLRRLWQALASNPALRRYVLAMILFHATIMVPGTALWLAQERFPDTAGWNPDHAAGRWNIAMWLAQALFGLGIARISQSHGPRPALLFVGLCSLAMPAVARRSAWRRSASARRVGS